jgi:hypothetical protein
VPVEAFDFRPTLTAIFALEKARGINAGINDARLLGSGGTNVPNTLRG